MKYYFKNDANIEETTIYAGVFAGDQGTILITPIDCYVDRKEEVYYLPTIVFTSTQTSTDRLYFSYCNKKLDMHRTGEMLEHYIVYSEYVVDVENVLTESQDRAINKLSALIKGLDHDIVSDDVIDR